MLRIIAASLVSITLLGATAASAGILGQLNDLVMFEQQLPPEPPGPQSTFTLHVPIIVYHSVRPHIPHESRLQDEFDITPELLAQQLQYLRDNGIKTITPEELAEELRAHQATTTKQVILTFDDGWRNQFTYAFPVLQNYHAKAVFYIYTNPISRAKHYMTWEEVRQLHDAGFTIGSHTITHPYLSQLSNAELEHEVADSKHILESMLQIPITDFASPFGYSDDRTEAAIRAAGYTTARTLYLGSTQSSDSLERMPAYLVDDSLADFENIVSH